MTGPRVRDTTSPAARENVRTMPLQQYLAQRPAKGMFPATSNLTAGIVTAVAYVMLAALVAYIALVGVGITN